MKTFLASVLEIIIIFWFWQKISKGSKSEYKQVGGYIPLLHSHY